MVHTPTLPTHRTVQIMPGASLRRLNRTLPFLQQRQGTRHSPPPSRQGQAHQYPYFYMHEPLDRQQGALDQSSTDGLRHLQSPQSPTLCIHTATRRRPLPCHVPMGGGGSTRTQTQLPNLSKDMDAQPRHAPPKHPIATHSQTSKTAPAQPV